MNLTKEGYRLLKTVCKIVCLKHEYHIRVLQLGWWIAYRAQPIAILHYIVGGDKDVLEQRTLQTRGFTSWKPL